MENKMVIYAKKESIDGLKEKFPGSKSVIDKETERIGKYLNSLSKEQLEKRQLWEREFTQFLEPVKDFIVFVNEEIKDPEEEIEHNDLQLKKAYDNIISLLKEYCDLKEEYYNITTLWIIGTYFHSNFPSYAYLYFNAMRGSGKSRVMNLITTLAHDGKMLNSLTEAVLFRTQGTLGIDEFEGMERKGGEALRELLNSGYKKGVTVSRMKRKKTEEGEEMVVEEFSVYRPIVMANIAGIENVLEDRCIPLILDKSDKSEITNLIEIFDIDERTIETKDILNKLSGKIGTGRSLKQSDKFSVVSVDVVSLGELYKRWNKYVKSCYADELNNTNNTHNTYNINNTNYTNLFEILKSSGINGRDLEICIPLIIVSNLFGDDILKKTTLTLQKLMSDKKEDNFTENNDVALIDFVSQTVETNNFKRLNIILQEFRDFTQSNEEWINSKWLGRALKRLNLIREKRRKSSGAEFILNVIKAQEKIRMFK